MSIQIILFLIGIFGLGRLAVNSLGLAWHRAEAWSLVVLFGCFLGAWALLIACSLFEFRIGTAVTLALLLAAWFLPQTRRPLEHAALPTRRQTAAWLIVTGAFSLIISDFLYREMLEPGPGGEYSGGGVSGDLALHLSIITNTAYATHLTWRFSLMANTYLTYPFLIDFLCGMIVRWGGSPRLSLMATSVPLCLVTVQLLFFLGYRLLKDARMAALFAALFLLGGSNGGIAPAISDYAHARSSLWSFLANPPQDYTDTLYYRFGNFITTVLMPQRGFQFGLPVFCAIVLLARRITPDMPIPQKRRILLLIGVVMGLLPLAHVHSFFMSFVALMVLAWYGRKTVALREWLPAFAVSLVLALPQIAFQLFANRHRSFVQYHPGWLYNHADFPGYSYYAGLSLYTLANFGIVLPLAAYSYFRLKDRGLIRGLVLLGAALFVAGYLFVFQPNYYDNIKFFIYAYLFFCLAIAVSFAQLSRAGRWQWAPLALLVVACGCQSVIRQFDLHMLFYPNRDVREAGDIRRQLPIDALVLTADYTWHPVWGLAGQPVVAGELNYLGSYGLPAAQYSSDTQAIYDGGADALPLLRKYRVQYVFISRYERMRYRAINEPFFDRHFPLVYRQDGVSIYQIRSAAAAA